MTGTHDDIMTALGNLQGTLESMKDNLDRGTKRMDHYDGRLRTVETRQAKFAGYAAGIGAIGGTTIVALAKKIGIY